MTRDLAIIIASLIACGGAYALGKFVIRIAAIVAVRDAEDLDR